MLEVVRQDSAERTPPHSLDAEKSVLGSVLIRPAVFDLLRLELETDDFFLPAHREIWEAMRAVAGRGRPIDALMLADELKARGMLPRLEGGEGYLLALSNAVPTAESAEHYADVVQEKARLRGIIATCADTMARAYSERAGSDELLEDTSRGLTKIATKTTTDLVTIGELAAPLMDEFDARQRRSEAGESAVTGISTGITRLDSMTAGFQPQELIVIAADTGGGKTALAMQTAIRLAAQDDGVGIAFNLEMPRTQLAERAFAHVGLVNSQRLKLGNLDYDDFKRLQSAAVQLVKQRLYLEEQVFTVREVEAKTRRVRAKHPDARMLFVVDFIQLMRSSGRDNRAREIGIIAQAMKQLAKNLNATGILISQLNRGGVKKDERPTMHDLKESGDIEQAADIIILSHNEDDTDDGDLTLYVDKYRSGSRMRVKAHWTGRYYRFSDPEIQPEPDRRLIDP